MCSFFYILNSHNQCMRFIRKIFNKFRRVILTLLGIGLPLFIYLGYIRQDPLFEPKYDIQIGRESVISIQNDSLENPLLPEREYPRAYSYLREMVSEITMSESIQYDNLYKYDSIRIIQRDDILNAFCTPGGYIYVYTGLIKYLDHPDHLAGVIGHEIAHAELRHSAIRLQKEFGRDKILDFILFSNAGVGGYIQARILSQMLTLDYSRDQETEADELSVVFLSESRFACDGVGGFFKKLVERGEDDAIPEFLSDHPDSKKRISNIDAKVTSLRCNCDLSSTETWEALKKSLPTPPQ